MRVFVSRGLVVALCVLLTVTRATAQSVEVDALFAKWARNDSPGCAVAVFQNGKIIHQRGYGMADLENGVAITPETVFNIASISKQFTVFLILLLAQAGLLSLDDDVRRHVPELPDFGKTITVRHLIHHTSGLREDWSMLTLAGWRSEDVITRDDVFGLIRRQKELNFAPGEDYTYCNSGYHLLAEIVRKKTGQSVREFGQAKVFEPLGMKQTVFQDDHRQLIKGRAQSYASKKGDGFERVLYGAGRAGPGNLHTTILDLAKWDQNFYQPKVGDARIIEQSLKKGKLNSGKEIDYAGGLRHSVHRGLPTIEHGGSIAGYRSHLLRFPEQKLTVVILANVSSFKPSALARKVAEVYLGKQMQPMAKPAAVTADALPGFAGEYRFASGFLLRFQAEGKTLFLMTETGKVALRPTSASEFVEGETGNAYTFAKGSVVMHGIGLDQSGQKVERPTLSAKQFDELTGRFQSDELDVIYTIQVRDGKLMLRHRKGELELRPLGADEFSAAPNNLFISLRFTRSAGDSVNGFRVSTPRLRHLRFDKVVIQP